MLPMAFKRFECRLAVFVLLEPAGGRPAWGFSPTEAGGDFGDDPSVVGRFWVVGCNVELAATVGVCVLLVGLAVLVPDLTLAVTVGECVGASDGEGVAVGCDVGPADGECVGALVGDPVGRNVGLALGFAFVGDALVDLAVGALVVAARGIQSLSCSAVSKDSTFLRCPWHEDLCTRIPPQKKGRLYTLSLGRNSCS